MEILLPPLQNTIKTTTSFSSKSTSIYTLRTQKFTPLIQRHHHNPLRFSSSPFLSTKNIGTSTTRTELSHATADNISYTASTSAEHFPWMVIMVKPHEDILVQSKAEILNFYVSVLKKALDSNNDEDAQRCMYDACYDNTQFGFCCIIDEPTARVLAGLPGVLSVKPDGDCNFLNKDCRNVLGRKENHMSNLHSVSGLLPLKGSKYWLVRVEKPSMEVSSKAQIIDYYVYLLTKVLGNEKDAQVCLYHVSSHSDFGFCCILDYDHAQELAAVPGVLSVLPDECFESSIKDYGGFGTSKTKLFITGLSFYTSEKTLRAAFEPFGELVEVKVIMDKISNRSKGYAFVEYSSKDSATKALQEMNGKIINGWVIVVDRAKSKPRFSRGRMRV